jgi:hypothetical protein
MIGGKKTMKIKGLVKDLLKEKQTAITQQMKKSRK